MNRNYCLICKNPMLKTDKKFNIEFHRTSCTNTLLRDFINNLLDNRIKYTTLNLCTLCYELINELDVTQKKSEDIRRKLINYFNNEIKFYSSLPQITPEPYVKEENELHFCDQDNEDDELDDNSDDDPLIKEDKKLSPKKNEDVSKKKKDDKKTGDKSKEFECQECKKCFKTKGELKNHMMMHTPLKPFICEICGQGYRNKSGFDIHVGMHNGIHPFTCPHCNKTFTQKGSLQRHLPMHTGETPFQCDLCGKRFIHHSSFKVHQMHHSGQKDHKCSICNLALMTGSHLRRHMKVHTGEKRYNCEICGKRFAERYNYAVHQKVHEKHGANIPTRKNGGNKTETNLNKNSKKTDEEENYPQQQQHQQEHQQPQGGYFESQEFPVTPLYQGNQNIQEVHQKLNTSNFNTHPTVPQIITPTVPQHWNYNT